MANLGPLTLGFLIAQPDFLIANPNIDLRTTAEQVQKTQDMIFITITRVTAFAVCEGRYPDPLAEANESLGVNCDCTAQDDTHQLIAKVSEKTLVFSAGNTHRVVIDGS